MQKPLSSRDLTSSEIPQGRALHIVDQLIAERAPHLVTSWAWPWIRPVLHSVLDYDRAVDLADALAPLSGEAALALCSEELSLRVETRGLEHLPATGRVIVVANHPTGLADGIAVMDALGHRRHDSIAFANADALRVCSGFAEVFIPVEWREQDRTRQKTRLCLEGAKHAFEAERCVVIFPAGRLSRQDEDGRLVDPDWAVTAVSLSRKFQAPILPVHIAGAYSALFHYFDRFSSELRDITLFHELLNKQGTRFDLTFGPLIAPERFGDDAALATLALKAYVENQLQTHPNRIF